MQQKQRNYYLYYRFGSYVSRLWPLTSRSFVLESRNAGRRLRAHSARISTFTSGTQRRYSNI